MVFIPGQYCWSLPSADPVPCAHCGRLDLIEVNLEDARTSYAKPVPTAWDRLRAEDGGLTPTPQVVEDPNQPIWLCRECAKKHHEFWDAQWEEFYAGLL